MKLNNPADKALIGSGVLAALASSLCCITPLLSVLAGISGGASLFSWLEPLRPYLIGLTVAVLGYAWYVHLKPRKMTDQCGCAAEHVKKGFFQSKKFLFIITLLSSLLITYPYYSSIFFPVNTDNTTVITDKSDIVHIRLDIEGMTCTGCEQSVKHALLEKNGVLEASSSYKEGIADIKFDKNLVVIEELSEAVVQATGYKVTNHQIIN